MTITLDTGGIAALVDKVSTGYGNIDFSIPNDDLSHFRGGQRAGEAMGEGELVINNTDYKYSTLNAENEITIGDKLIIVADLPETPTGFGAQPFGEGPFGLSTFEQFDPLGTYRVLDWDIIEYGPEQSDYTLTIGNFVWACLQAASVFYSGTNRPLSGSSDAILNQIITDEIPHISPSGLPVIDELFDYFAAGVDGATAVNEIAALAADAGTPVIQTSEGDNLVLQPIREQTARTDIRESDLGQFSVSSESHNLVNQLRIDGGIDDEGNIEEGAVTSVSSFQKVTDTTQLVTQVSVRKAEVSRVELYTRGMRGTLSNTLRVRFQSSNEAGTGPIEPEDLDSDLADSGVVDIEDSADGWRSFDFGENTIPTNQPWMIVESESQTGHEVGVNAQGVPAHRIYWPKPIALERAEIRSQRRYGVYERHIRDEALATGDAVRMRAQSELNRHAWPDTTVGPLECVEPIAHTLQIGDSLRIQKPEMKLNGEYVVTSKDDTYQNVKLQSTVELTEVDTYV